MTPFALNTSIHRIRCLGLRALKVARVMALAASLMAAVNALGQQAEVIRLDKLLEIIRSENDRILVVNFWATWCAPCLKELPFLEKVSASMPDVHVRLVSLDMDLDPNPEKVRSFVARKKIVSDVLILDERNPNSWIEKLEKKWSGAIPATIIVNNRNGRRKFVEGQLKEGDLERLIEEVR